MKIGLRVSLCMALSLLLAAPIWAQQGSGKITGHVQDVSNALIPGVTATLTSSSIMGTRTAITDERGVYVFDLLPTGSYSVKFELQGFKTLLREGVQIPAGFTATINVDLEVASVAETVTVTGDSPLVNLESATLSTNFGTAQLQNLPNGRDIWSTLGQTPGIVMTLFDVGGSQAGNYSPYRTYGTSNGPDDYLNLDGVRYNYMYLDYGSYEEMQVVSASKAAEVRNAGVYMNSVVKTGGNDIHSMVYTGFTPESFKGNNLNDTLRGYGLTTTNKLTFFSDLNGNVGGPIKKDKIWWFFSARDNYIGTSSPGFVNGGCSGPLACTGKPIGTYVNDDTTVSGNFYTRLENVTLKLSSQLNPKNQISALANFSDKRYPYRNGSGALAGYFTTDSVARQTYPGWIYSFHWTSVLTNRITLDTSFNRNGYHWPNDRRVDEYSRRDLDTLMVRGGLSGSGTGFTGNGGGSGGLPNTFDPTDHQLNVSLAFLTDKFITGSHNFKVGYSYKHETVTTKYHGSIGDIVLYYRGGFQTPAFIDTFDAPFDAENGVNENSFFVQDTWKITRRLTVNPGFRLDRAVSFYPQQVKKGIGPYQTAQTIATSNIPSITGPVLRFSFVYDVFGNGKTAFKGGYSRYNRDPGGTEEPAIASASNPIAQIQSRYNWAPTATNGQPPANCYLTVCNFNPVALGLTPVSVTGGPNRSVDPNLSFAYINEYTASVDQQFKTDFSLHLGFVQKYDKNPWRYFNTAIPYSAYDIPVTVNDPGRPGLAARTLPFWSLERAYVGLRKDFITNDPNMSNTNTTWEASITKRISNKWQFMTGWDYLHRKVWTQSTVASNSSGLADDPNNRTYNGGEHYNTWTYKAMGTYYAPYGIVASSVLRLAKGLPYGRTLTTPSLNQGSINATVEPVGTFFMDNQKLLDVRAEKSFQATEHNKVAVMFDVFNLGNAATVTGINSTTGAKFGYPTSTVEPRTYRISMRYNF